MSLFPSSSSSGSKNLVEFRAGKLFRDGNMVKPDNRKGLVFVYEADEMLHICWKDRKTGALEDDWIVFPEDAIFEKVPQCTTGRVFVLRILSADMKAFFWMQEPKTDKDEHYLTTINRLINTPAGGFGDGFAFGQPSAAGDLNARDALAQDQLLRMFQSIPGNQGIVNSPSPAAPAALPQVSVPESAGPPAHPPAPAPVPSLAPGSIPLNQLQSILSGIQVPEQKPDADLTRVLTVETLSPLFADAEVQRQLFPFLPEKSERTREELEDIVRSPQFVQALASLNAGLQSGQLGPLIAELGLDPSVGGPLGGVEAFLRALQAKADQKKSS